MCIGLLFTVTEYDENILINKENMKKRFEFNDHPSYVQAGKLKGNRRLTN